MVSELEYGVSLIKSLAVKKINFNYLNRNILQ